MKYELKPFNLEFSEELYDYGFDIPEELVQRFLSADRAMAIEDLENIIKDGYVNFDSEVFDDEDLSLIHALFLLAELNADESLPLVIDMLKQDEEFFEHTFSDMLTQDGWLALFKIGKNNFDAYFNLLKSPDVYTYTKSSIADTLEQIYLHFPDKRDELELKFQDYLNYLIQVTDNEENEVDTEFIGLFICNLMDLNLSQFLPQLKVLFERDTVSIGVCGTYPDVKNDINQKQPLNYIKREIKSILEIYKPYLKLNRELEAELIERELKYNKIQTPKKAKIGRNDSCPCGSGKKFKKCCLGKGIYD